MEGWLHTDAHSNGWIPTNGCAFLWIDEVVIIQKWVRSYHGTKTNKMHQTRQPKIGQPTRQTTNEHIH
jgi:hypothetical protein